MATPPRTRPVAIVLVLGAIVAFSLYGIPLLDALVFNPWALSVTGKPTLTGTWSGTLQAGDGDQRSMSLVIGHVVPRERCSGDCYMKGTVRLCRGGTLEREFTITGGSDTWSGEAFHVDLHSDRNYREGELRLGRLQGAWDRADAIRFTAPWWLHSQTAVAEARRGEATGERPVVTFELHRGGKPEC